MTLHCSRLTHTNHLQVGLTNPPNTLNFRFAKAEAPSSHSHCCYHSPGYHRIILKNHFTSLDLPAPNQKQPKNRIFQPTDSVSLTSPPFLWLRSRMRFSWFFFSVSWSRGNRNSPSREGKRQILDAQQKWAVEETENFPIENGVFFL